MAGENSTKKARMGEPICPLSSPEDNRTKILYDGENNANVTDRVAGDAMSNYLVLKHVFSHLDTSDLNSCCEVNKLWNSLADPLLVTYYDIKLKQTSYYDDDGDTRPAYSLTITKRATYKSDQIDHGIYILEDAVQFLEEAQAAKKPEKIALNLHISISWYFYNETVSNFLCKIGPMVEKVCVDDLLKPTKFYEMLVRFFPNLKHLDLSDTSFDDSVGDQEFDESLENQMKCLKRVDNFEFMYDPVPVINIFRMAPNLAEIHDFPILLANALVETQKAGCVKSLAYPKNGLEVKSQIQSALEKLASLDLKLRSFRFEQFLLSNSEMESFVQRILTSSCDSLQSLTLCKTESFNFKAIPPTYFLKEIAFWMKDENESSVAKFFAPDIELHRQFPNVSVINIPTLLSHYPISDITTRLPVSQFASWGSRIEKLKLLDVTVNLLQQLSKLFPSITNLEFRVGEKCNELKFLLRAIGKFWPEMEILTVHVDYSVYSSMKKAHDKERSFDSIFTGISDKILEQLRDPVARMYHFTTEEMEEFKEGCTFRRLRKLKTLKFHIDSMSNYKFVEKLSAATPVSREFGFQFLPELKVVVRTHRDDHFHQVTDMKTALRPLVNFKMERFELLHFK